MRNKRRVRPRRADSREPLAIVHEGIPDKVPAADNETGTRMALANLVKLVGAG